MCNNKDITNYATLKGHNRPIYSIAFHPNAQIIATGSDDTTVKLWHISSSTNCIKTLYGNSTRVCFVIFHSNGLYMAICSGYGSAKLYSLRPTTTPTPTVIPTAPIHTSTNGIPDPIHTATLFGHSSAIRSLSFHPSLRILATGGCDNTIKLWKFDEDGSNIKCYKTLYNHTSIVCSIIFHPSLCLLATGSCDKTIRLWTLNENCTNVTYCKTLYGHTNYIFSIAFHPLYSIIGSGSWDKTIKLWSIDNNSLNMEAIECSTTLYGHNDAVYSIAFHPFAPILASGSSDKTIKLWRFNSTGTYGQCIMTLYENIDIIYSITFNTNTMAANSSNNIVKLWNISNIIPFPYERFILAKNHLLTYLSIDIVEKILKISFNMYGEKRIEEALALTSLTVTAT
jgi:WD40 repeat protein